VREINPQTHLLGANSGISFQENVFLSAKKKKERKKERICDCQQRQIIEHSTAVRVK
jgi:hypothetical protein